VKEKPMSEHTPLTFVALTAALVERRTWALVDGSLVRSHSFASWQEAFASLAPIAAVAERLDHHPDWSQRGATLRIELTTHHPRGISQLDLDLADAIDTILPEVVA
jgi:4a-hydroxytetrahydrobiopterin dehydratase